MDGRIRGEFRMKRRGENLPFFTKAGFPSNLARTRMPGATFSMTGPRINTISSGSFLRVEAPKKTSLASWRP